MDTLELNMIGHPLNPHKRNGVLVSMHTSSCTPNGPVPVHKQGLGSIRGTGHLQGELESGLHNFCIAVEGELHVSNQWVTGNRY